MAIQKKINKESKETNYGIELINSLYDKDFDDFKYLQNVLKDQPSSQLLGTIIALLEIFENIINVNNYGEFNQASVNRLVSQLTNINLLSRAIDKDQIYTLKQAMLQVVGHCHKLQEKYDNGVDIQSEKIENLAEEFISAITGDYDSDFKLLNLDKDKPPQDHLLILSKLNSAFECLLDDRLENGGNVNKLSKRTSSLVNIERISKNTPADVYGKLKEHLRKAKLYELNRDHIHAGGYAQEGEDLVIKRFFPLEKIGFYIEIGAHHPSRFSNTFLFYQRGWRGITIDPLPGSEELFKVMRPEDTHLQLAVGNESGGMVEYVMFEETAYNCIVKAGEEQPNLLASPIINRLKIPTKTLNEILLENPAEIPKIDLLSIDVEGYEEEIFEGFNVEKYLPQVIVIELRGVTLENASENAIYKRLKKCGYTLRSLLFHSFIFTRIEE